MPDPKPAPNAKDQPDAPFVVEAPPEEEFWDRYNRRLEFPLAAVGAVMFHVFVLVGLVWGLLSLLAGDKKPDPELRLAQVGGIDDFGEGSAGSGGNPDADATKEADPLRAPEQHLPDKMTLAQAQENVRKNILEDPTGNLPVAPSNAAAFSQLSETMQQKLFARRGSGPGAGKGDDGSAGKGPGGTGADSTRARGMRWVIRFNFERGIAQYIDQLKAMDAELLFPVPPSEKDGQVIRDLNNPTQRRMATDEDFRRLAGKIGFGHPAKDLVQGVAQRMQLDFTPKTYWVFLSKEIEDELSRLEKNYRNRRPEDIELTIFSVRVTGGRPTFRVEEQKAR